MAGGGVLGMAGILITVFFHLPLLFSLYTYQQQRELSKHAWGQELGAGNRNRGEEYNGQELEEDRDRNRREKERETEGIGQGNGEG